MAFVKVHMYVDICTYLYMSIYLRLSLSLAIYIYIDTRIISKHLYSHPYTCVYIM